MGVTKGVAGHQLVCREALTWLVSRLLFEKRVGARAESLLLSRRSNHLTAHLRAILPSHLGHAPMDTVPWDLLLSAALGRSLNAQVIYPALKPPSNQIPVQSPIHAPFWVGSRPPRTPDLGLHPQVPGCPLRLSLVCTLTPGPQRRPGSGSPTQAWLWFVSRSHQAFRLDLSVRPSRVIRNPTTCALAASSRPPLQSQHYRPHRI